MKITSYRLYFTKMRFLSLILTVVISPVLGNPQSEHQSDYETINLRAIAKEVNLDRRSLWKADTYGFSEIGMNEIKRKLGVKLGKNEKSTLNKLLKFKSSADGVAKLGADVILPRSYDARQRYPECISISRIRDQSTCGSCWAVSAVSALGDRLCIKSKGRYNYELSSRYLLGCDESNDGCNGGYLDLAWKFLEKNGTVSGGEFETDEGCQPYPMHPCGWPKKLACPMYLTPKCLKYKCDNELYKDVIEKNPIKAWDSYRIEDGASGTFNEYFIRDEIFYNGPVQAGFNVYEDLFTYKSGIYIRRRSRLVGGHAVKIIGWGEEKGTKYWLIANSWGENWGENGTFRMLRGTDHCGIESEVYAGTPMF